MKQHAAGVVPCCLYRNCWNSVSCILVCAGILIFWRSIFRVFGYCQLMYQPHLKHWTYMQKFWHIHWHATEWLMIMCVFFFFFNKTLPATQTLGGRVPPRQSASGLGLDVEELDVDYAAGAAGWASIGVLIVFLCSLTCYICNLTSHGILALLTLTLLFLEWYILAEYHFKKSARLNSGICLTYIANVCFQKSSIFNHSCLLKSKQRITQIFMLH